MTFVAKARGTCRRCVQACVIDKDHYCEHCRPTDDDEVREQLVTLIRFVAIAQAHDDAKNDALDAIQKLQARLLP